MGHSDGSEIWCGSYTATNPGQYKCVGLQAGSCFTEREFLDGLRSKVV